MAPGKGSGEEGGGHRRRRRKEWNFSMSKFNAFSSPLLLRAKREEGAPFPTLYYTILPFPRFFHFLSLSPASHEIFTASLLIWTRSLPLFSALHANKNFGASWIRNAKNEARQNSATTIVYIPLQRKWKKKIRISIKVFLCSIRHPRFSPFQIIWMEGNQNQRHSLNDGNRPGVNLSFSLGWANSPRWFHCFFAEKDNRTFLFLFCPTKSRAKPF